jgi:AbrB family looped-hinge helix DNA binding protein
MANEIMRITSKGQLTIPVSIRKELKLKSGDYLRVNVENQEIRLKKVETILPLSSDDPIWSMIGVGESGQKNISVNHDAYLSQGEIKRWKR